MGHETDNWNAKGSGGKQLVRKATWTMKVVFMTESKGFMIGAAVGLISYFMGNTLIMAASKGAVIFFILVAMGRYQEISLRRLGVRKAFLTLFLMDYKLKEVQENDDYNEMHYTFVRKIGRLGKGPRSKVSITIISNGHVIAVGTGPAVSASGKITIMAQFTVPLDQIDVSKFEERVINGSS